MVGPISMTGSSDPLSGGYRIRAITPVTLPAGIYTVVTIGHSSSDKNGSTTIGGTGTLVNTGTGEISFNSSSYGGSGFGLPTTTYAGNNVFHAGTFGFTTGCAGATEAITVTVNPVPAATIAYAGSPYCNSGGTATVTFTGVAGGTYSSTAGLTINTSTGTVTPGSSTPGSYTVTYTLAAAGGCPLFTTTANIIIAVPGTWTGAVSTAWHTAGNWYCGSIPTISTDVIIATGLPRYPLVSSGTMTARNITIQTGASLTVTTILQIAGALSNAGTFTASNGTIELTGSSAQAIPASLFATNSIRNLTINNTAGVTLGGTLGVTGILKATTGSFNTGGYLTLISSATQTALIDGTGAGNVLGNVTMQRYLPSGFGYRYISSPFQAAKVSELGDDLNLNASFPPLYRYDENLAYAGWVKHIDTNGLLNPLAGYAVNFGAATPARTINMKGVVNNGSIGPATLYNHNRTYTQGFNLVGNPYPSPINWTAASGWTKTNIDNAIYYFNNGVADQYQGTYSSYINGVSSDGVASNTIPSMQGFFIHVSNGAYPVSATLSATNGVRVTTPNPTFHKVTNVEPYPMVRISAGYQDGAGLSDPTVVYFDPASSLAYNRELDALKMLNTDERVPSLYSLSASEKLSIHAIPANADTTLIIPLGIKTDKEGKVVFKARDIVELPAGLHPYFADAQNSAIQDLELIPEYGQVLGKGVHENRFYLIFARQLPAGIPGIKQALKAYSSGGSLFVYLPDAQGEIRIINTAGQLVKTETLSGAGYHQIRMEGASGLYLVSLSTAEGLVSGKVFVGQ